MSQYIEYLSNGIVVFACLFLIFCMGVLLYKFSSSFDSSTMKSMGIFAYRIICKSGFMVIVVVIVTYFICKNGNVKNHAGVNKNPDAEKIVKN